MSQQGGTISSSAKKGIVLTILIAAGCLLLLILFAKSGSRSIRIIQEGDRPPDFRLTSLDGKQVGLSDYRGKVVMVHFWATWCPPCIDEIPTLDRLYRSMTGKDFVILAVSVDEGGAESVGPFLQRNRLSLPVLLDPDHAVSASYGTFKFPETYLIDRSGAVRYKVIGPRDWSSPESIRVLSDMIAGK